MHVREVTSEEYERLLAEIGPNPPIEQTPLWQKLDQQAEGREFWGYVAIEDDDGQPKAACAFMDYETHGYHFLRSHHGPFWKEEPTEQEEAAAIEALSAFVHEKDHKVVFLRLCVLHDLPACRPVLSTVPYDTTVVVDLTGGDDAILSRMKARGRRDVRKALRESPITCADETERAIASFAEYYVVMQDTGNRDGFTPAPLDEYQNFVRTLGKDHCLVSVGRDEDGAVVGWAIDTIWNDRAVHYYAASSTRSMRSHVMDRLYYFCFCELGKRGVTSIDLMAIGSDFSPSLMGLNEFKTKFTPEVTHVAPDRDVPLRGVLYGSLQKLKSLRGGKK